MRRFLSVLAAVALTLVWTLSAVAQTAPTISIEPSSGSGGTTITYQGTGFTPNGEVTVVISADGLIVDEVTADGSGAIGGSFQAPNRGDITGESSNAIPVFAIDRQSGAESNRVTFTYVQPSLPDAGVEHVAVAMLFAIVVLLGASGYALRRAAAVERA